MRSVRCIIFLLLYVALFNLYIYELPREYMATENCKILYNAITVGMVVFCRIDAAKGYESAWHKELNLICFLAVVFNYLIIILCYMKFIKDSFTTLALSNGSVFVVSLMVLISGKRHNEFNK